MLLEAGAPLPAPGDRHDHSQLADAAQGVTGVLREHGWQGVP